jgi:hypothetical protein
MLLQTRSASETGHRLSEKPVGSRNGKDLPGYWTVLFLSAVVQHPAGPVLASPLLLSENDEQLTNEGHDQLHPEKISIAAAQRAPHQVRPRSWRTRVKTDLRRDTAESESLFVLLVAALQVARASRPSWSNHLSNLINSGGRKSRSSRSATRMMGVRSFATF